MKKLHQLEENINNKKETTCLVAIVVLFYKHCSVSYNKETIKCINSS